MVFLILACLLADEIVEGQDPLKSLSVQRQRPIVVVTSKWCFPFALNIELMTGMTRACVDYPDDIVKGCLVNVRIVSCVRHQYIHVQLTTGQLPQISERTRETVGLTVVTCDHETMTTYALYTAGRYTYTSCCYESIDIMLCVGERPVDAIFTPVQHARGADRKVEQLLRELEEKCIVRTPSSDPTLSVFLSLESRACMR